MGVALFLFALGIAETARAAELCTPEIARIVSLQGAVQVQRAGTLSWADARLDQPLCVGDLVRVGPLGRAALAFVDDSVLRLDQNTTLHLRGGAERERTLLELVLGAVYFFSHRPRALEIGTPFVNAGTEGTEFLVRVSDDFTRIIMFEGRVRATNPQGELLLAAGEAALARPGEAPRPEIVVRPRDAVAWALYYPPVFAVLAGRDALPEDLPRALQNAARHAAENRYASALQVLDEVPEGARDARYWAFRAGVLLNVGRIEAAEEAIARALELEPAAGDALAQRAIVEIVRNQPQAALGSARRAVEQSPGSAAARVALSYALQANLELEEAWHELRAATDAFPDDPLIWARLAEVELARGYLGRALEAAERAAALAPGLGRTQMVLGFAHLARIDPGEARAAFVRAIELEPANPLSRLGFGLARIRQGELAAGRHEVEIATALDANQSLIRSYLGKAYFEETRDELAGEQLAIAKQLDPNDPTPWFYDAIRKQATNRPVEALRDLETSIRLNDNRAVYRSRLLLDEDLAARGARLGRIYNDLGFEQLALVEGWKSVAIEPANHAAHRLLADTYSALPGHQMAQDSELLQSQLLQPININPVQPRLASNRLSFLNDTGPGDVAFNEFTRLFTVTDPLTVHFDGIVGTQDTYAYNAVASGIYDRFSYSAGHFHFETDGFRSNNDLQQDIFDAFLQAALSPSTSVLTEFRLTDQEEGDRALRFDPTSFLDPLRVESDTRSARIGLRHDFSPAATTIATYAYRELDGRVDATEFGFLGLEEEDVHFGELRHLYRAGPFNVDIGGGYLRGGREETFLFEGEPPFQDDPDLEHANVYVYGRSNYPEDVQLTLGVSAEKVDDSTIDRSQLNPKIGLMWNVTPNTLLRAAAFRTVKRNVISSQTLEPTHVAGFNQFFDGFNGTDAWRYGIGLDHKLTDELFLGAELTHRELDVPIFFSTTPPSTVQFDVEESFGRLYLYWTPSDRVAVSAEYRFDRIDTDPEASLTGALESTTHRFPLEIRWFHPSGLLAWARGTYVDQEGLFQHAVTRAVEAGSDNFWVFDGAVGFRFPNQYGLALVEVRNLFDEDFRFQDIDPQDPSILPERAIFGRLIVRF